MNPVSKQLAVIMARGASQRMGQPKGLCRLPDQDDCFLTQVVRLYRGLEIPVLLVLRPEDEAAYSEIVRHEDVEILAAAGGGDTAQTMKLALEWAQAKGLTPDIYWAHPVDMPLVSAQSISLLLATAAKNDMAAWRPEFHQQPGHPVLFPGPLLALVLTDENIETSMSRIWKKAMAQSLVLPINLLKVADPGVIADFDTPDQLRLTSEKKAPES